MAELEATLPRAVPISLAEKRLRIASICVALFTVTFGLYWFIGPQETPYPHQVNQATPIEAAGAPAPPRSRGRSRASRYGRQRTGTRFGPPYRWCRGKSYQPTRERPDLDLVDLLLRVSRLADDLPEVTELELDLGGAAVIDARVKVEPYQPQDPYLRRLR